MKLNLKRLIFLTVIALFNMNIVFAGDPPPPAPGFGPETPPDLPIDSSVFALLIAALFLGFYIISKRKQSIKT